MDVSSTAARTIRATSAAIFPVNECVRIECNQKMMFTQISQSSFVIEVVQLDARARRISKLAQRKALLPCTIRSRYASGSAMLHDGGAHASTSGSGSASGSFGCASPVRTASAMLAAGVAGGEVKPAAAAAEAEPAGAGGGFTRNERCRNQNKLRIALKANIVSLHEKNRALLRPRSHAQLQPRKAEHISQGDLLWRIKRRCGIFRNEHAEKIGWRARPARAGGSRPATHSAAHICAFPNCRRISSHDRSHRQRQRDKRRSVALRFIHNHRNLRDPVFFRGNIRIHHMALENGAFAKFAIAILPGVFDL